MVIKLVKYYREVNRVRVKGYWVSQLGIHWWYAEVLLLKAKVLTHLHWTVTYPILLLSPHPIYSFHPFIPTKFSVSLLLILAVSHLNTTLPSIS